MFPALILILAIVLFRIAPWLGDGEALKAVSGYSPLMAFALCSGIFLPKKWAVWFPVAAFIASGVVINLISGRSVFHYTGAIMILSMAAVALAGVAVKKKASVAAILGTSLLSTVLFYLVSNTVSFFMDAGYPQTLAGWWQSQTTGLPGYLPTWVFGLRQVAGDLAFTALFYAAFRSTLPHPSTLRAAETFPAVA